MKSRKILSTPNFDRITPRDCVNAKVRRLHKMLDAIYQAALKPFGLKGSMLSILFITGKNDKINQKSIADLLVLDQSTVSRDIKRLVSRGWINVYRGTDPRVSVLEISEEGYKLLEEVSPIWEGVHAKVERLLGQFNIQQLDTIMYAIKSNGELLK